MLSRSATRFLGCAAVTVAIIACSNVNEPAIDAPAEAVALAEGSRLNRFGPYQTDWSVAVPIGNYGPGAHPNFNTTALDGCPAPSRDGKLFFIASTRPGSQGIDIWVSARDKESDPWGEPVNVGAPVNSASNDFCPMLAKDGRFFFVSNRPGGCGGTDIYVSRRRPDGTFEAPENLGCAADGGVNSNVDEAGPIPLNEPGSGPVLYFSSVRSGAGDIYRATWDGGRYRNAGPVTQVNTASVEGQPFVREDGLEMFFFSNRPGSMLSAAGTPSNDIWYANRARAKDAWSAPVHLDGRINSGASETRPSLSPDGSVLYFGSTRIPGRDNDIHASQRTTGR
ncbi:MAG TPA: hypothetical protein VE869_01600 [Gemmatimonas sp.]|nr:hypothetical protein [Gemmatimonas sp.]